MDASNCCQESRSRTKDVEWGESFQTDRVLISARNPTDAESVAQRIYNDPRWPRGPVTTVDCAEGDVVDEEVLGRIMPRSDAEPCTVLLKEVGRLSREKQDQLLSALSKAALFSSPIPMRSRVIALTSEQLFDRVRTGTFDEQLFYRLNVIHLDLRS